MNRTMYHPVPIGEDFVRKNAFELIIGGSSSYSQLRIMCKSVNVTLPASNAVAVPWVSGIMQVAGRISTAYTFTATFITGVDSTYDAYQSLYNWRQLVFNHESGRIGLASEYKQESTLNVYDVTGDDAGLQYVFKYYGVWPTNMDTVTFSVDDDTPLEVSVSFAADKLQILSFAGGSGSGTEDSTEPVMA